VETSKRVGQSVWIRLYENLQRSERIADKVSQGGAPRMGNEKPTAENSYPHVLGVQRGVYAVLGSSRWGMGVK